MAQPEKYWDKLVTNLEVGKTITLDTSAQAVILTKNPTTDPRCFVELELCFTGTNPESCIDCDERASCPLVKRGLRA